MINPAFMDIFGILGFIVILILAWVFNDENFLIKNKKR